MKDLEKYIEHLLCTYEEGLPEEVQTEDEIKKHLIKWLCKTLKKSHNEIEEVEPFSSFNLSRKFWEK
jgi:hypothetical protein